VCVCGTHEASFSFRHLLITVVLAAEVIMYRKLKGCDLMGTAAGFHHVVRNIEQNLYWEMILGWLNLTAFVLGSGMVQMGNAEELQMGNLKGRDHLGAKLIIGSKKGREILDHIRLANNRRVSIKRWNFFLSLCLCDFL